jgi:hypothetical protein
MFEIPKTDFVPRYVGTCAYVEIGETGCICRKKSPKM